MFFLLIFGAHSVCQVNRNQTWSPWKSPGSRASSHRPGIQGEPQSPGSPPTPPPEGADEAAEDPLHWCVCPSSIFNATLWNSHFYFARVTSVHCDFVVRPRLYVAPPSVASGHEGSPVQQSAQTTKAPAVEQNPVRPVASEHAGSTCHSAATPALPGETETVPAAGSYK